MAYRFETARWQFELHLYGHLEAPNITHISSSTTTIIIV